MFEGVQHKIKTSDEIRKLIGGRPRKKKVAMCHGVFDIVHPGHLRHLMYARSRGDLLIASLTCDAHIEKGASRPYVPEDLRAANLAAFEIVDYVIIDREKTPIANILKLQPDYFVKGFEYSKEGVHPKTQEEMDVVASFGGEFIFSPGDIVYSSTQILSKHQPNLTYEKLATLFSASGLDLAEIERAFEQMRGISAHVVGDTIVDTYSYGTLLGKTTKTPTFSIKLDRSETFVGGAGVVAKHLAGLGANVTFSTVLGDDSIGEFVLKDLKESGVEVLPIIDPSRPTTVKQRFWAGEYKMLQVDTVNNSPITKGYVDALATQVAKIKSAVVVMSDFRHGIFHSDSIAKITEAVPNGVLKTADSQVSSRWGNILQFKGFDLVTPNEDEARFSLADQDSGIRSLAQRIYEESKARYVILKLGHRGILTYCAPSEGPRSFFHIDSFVDQFVDGVGAGDALLAATSLALAAKAPIIVASSLGSMAAAVACETMGNVPLTRASLLNKIKSVQKSVRLDRE